MAEEHEDKIFVTDVGQREVQEAHNTKVPLFLYVTYAVLPLWGIWFMFAYWNGTTGWTDAGYWHQLQIASNTTNVRVNLETPLPNKNEVQAPAN